MKYRYVLFSGGVVFCKGRNNKGSLGFRTISSLQKSFANIGYYGCNVHNFCRTFNIKDKLEKA